jgi:hypothetical protein
MSHEEKPEPSGPETAAQFSAEIPLGDVAAWTEIDPGRYMPRRVRGSYQGRALG